MASIGSMKELLVHWVCEWRLSGWAKSIYVSQALIVLDNWTASVSDESDESCNSYTRIAAVERSDHRLRGSHLAAIRTMTEVRCLDGLSAVDSV